MFTLRWVPVRANRCRVSSRTWISQTQLVYVLSANRAIQLVEIVVHLKSCTAKTGNPHLPPCLEAKASWSNGPSIMATSPGQTTGSSFARVLSEIWRK